MVVDPVKAFIDGCAVALSEGAHDSGTREGAAVLSAALVNAEHTPDRYQPGWLPALDSIDQVASDQIADDHSDGDLANRFVEVARLLPWKQASQAGTDTSQVAVSDLDRVVDVAPLRLGLMYLAPGARTALHHHPPQEAYLLISGRSQWRYGGSSEFRPFGAPGVLYNNPDDLHAAVVGDRPHVAMFVLWD